MIYDHSTVKVDYPGQMGHRVGFLPYLHKDAPDLDIIIFDHQINVSDHEIITADHPRMTPDHEIIVADHQNITADHLETTPHHTKMTPDDQQIVAGPEKIITGQPWIIHDHENSTSSDKEGLMEVRYPYNGRRKGNGKLKRSG